jgi:hypothetical protein
MINIYSKDAFEIATTMSSEQIHSALDAVVEPPKWFRWPTASSKIFQGEFSADGFKIMRIIKYRNSFLPIIEGVITPTASGKMISVTMRLHRFVGIFMLVWLSGVIIGVVTFLAAALSWKMAPLPALQVPLGMLVFGIALTSGGFWWEAKKTKPIIIKIFNKES